MLAFEPDAPFLEPFDNTGDVDGSAGDAGADQSARGIHAEFLMLDESRGVELFGQVTGGEFVGAVEALAIAQALVDKAFHRRAVLPAETGRPFAPDVSFAGLYLAKMPLGTGAWATYRIALSLARSKAFQIAALSAGVAANSLARLTDLCDENTKSKPLCLRLCCDQASPVSAAHPAVAAGVIGDKSPAFLELAAGLVES